MAKQSPLSDLHRANRATLEEREGWLLPLHFGDCLAEYQAVRSQVGVLDLCDRSVLSFTGVDRASFLQGMVSNDVKILSAGQGTYAALLDLQGKILADARILCLNDSFLMDLWEPLKEKIIAHLNHYLIADDVEITDLTGQYDIVSLQGPKALPLLTEFLADKIPSRELDHSIFRIDNAEVLLIRSTHTGEEGFDLLIRAEDLLPVVQRLQKAGKKLSLQWVGLQAQEILRIEAGIPRFGVDMDENNLLLETGLDCAVSFQKGCYLGQEVVERIHSRGHVNKRLVGMLLEGDMAAKRGSVIRSGEKEIGRVTSSVLSPARERPLAFGYVNRDYLQPGTPVSVHINGKIIPGQICPLPFYKRSS